MMCRAFVLLLFLCVAPPASAAVRSLLTIGNDLGETHETPLRFAETDARRLQDVWVELGGVSPARATLLTGATPQDVVDELTRLRGQIQEIKRRGERAELIVTFSGHGDEESWHLAGTRLPIARVQALLRDIPADAVLVIVDACRTSPIRSGATRGAKRGPAFDVTFIKDPTPTGRVWLSSASVGEVAQESDDIEGAWFTHHVTAGLRGAADSDRNGEVTLSELFRHAHARTVSQSFAGATVQHPEIDLALTGEGDLSLTRLDRAAATLLLTATLAGSFLVVDDRQGDVLFEVEKAAGSPLALAVPPRRLRIQHRQGAQLRIADANMVRGSRTTLSDSDFDVVDRLVARTRGSDVDPSPFVMHAAITVGSGLVASTSTTNLQLQLERRLAVWPVFAIAGGSIGQGKTSSSTRTFLERQAQLWVGLAVEQWTIVGRGTAGIGAGAQWIGQDIERRDHKRLRAAGFDDAARASGYSAGPTAVLPLSWLVPVYGSCGVIASVTPQASVVRRDGDIALTPSITAGAGAACEW